MNNREKLNEILNDRHGGDEQQLKVIFSKSPRIIVEAPAGYGKTTTMISRIAYLLATDSIPNPKKILALTFSVNAALKVKREISENLPSLMEISNNPLSLSSKSIVTNFHGFCKTVLKKYGFLLCDTLRKDINLFKAIGDEEISKNKDIKNLLSKEENETIQDVIELIKTGNFPEKEIFNKYNNIMFSILLPNGYITHNGVILLTIDLFQKHKEIQRFFQQYFSLIIVDEFQDTNSIAWQLLRSLITPKTQLLFLGDPLQRIYGFIGAIPNVMKIATDELELLSIPLTQNYRFKNNNEMLKLDFNIRANALKELNFQANDEQVAALPAFWGESQEKEIEMIAHQIKSILVSRPKDKIAILCRARSFNSNAIEKTLKSLDINYFYGMFTDDDQDYIDFHRICQDEFIRFFERKHSVTQLSLERFVKNIEKFYSQDTNITIESLLILLNSLVKKISIDYSHLSPEDKYLLIIDVFENRQLKQSMEYVDTNLILTTIHSAKGLEWDYVFVVDLERWIFPTGLICYGCPNINADPVKSKCPIPALNNEKFKNCYLDELSVFYVAVTRAKKQVFVSASKERINRRESIETSCFSCFANLSGIKLINGEGYKA